MSMEIFQKIREMGKPSIFWINISTEPGPYSGFCERFIVNKKERNLTE